MIINTCLDVKYLRKFWTMWCFFAVFLFQKENCLQWCGSIFTFQDLVEHTKKPYSKTDWYLFGFHKIVLVLIFHENNNKGESYTWNSLTISNDILFDILKVCINI